MWLNFNCDKFYFGKTGRPFIKRFKEHIQNKSLSQKSNFADHPVQSNHGYNSLTDNL